MIDATLRSQNALAVTLDIDWAPDFVIDAVAEQLLSRSVKATWFVTHASPAVDRLAAHPDLFELGMHPNFLPGSDHGRNPVEALSFLSTLVPSAVSVRTHALVQSGPIFDDILRYTNVTVDSSLFLPRMPGIQPVPYWRRGTRAIWRLPIFWSDVAEMELSVPDWSLQSLLQGEGLKVLDFHPIHVYLNSTDPEQYSRLKQHVRRLDEASPEAVRGYVHNGIGAGTLFSAVLEHSASRAQSFCLWELAPSGVAHARCC